MSLSGWASQVTVTLLSVVLVSWSIAWLGAKASTERGAPYPVT